MNIAEKFARRLIDLHREIHTSGTRFTRLLEDELYRFKDGSILNVDYRTPFSKEEWEETQEAMARELKMLDAKKSMYHKKLGASKR